MGRGGGLFLGELFFFGGGGLIIRILYGIFIMMFMNENINLKLNIHQPV